MRTVKFTELDTCEFLESDGNEGAIHDAGYELVHADAWLWEDGYVRRCVVIRHVETGVLFMGHLRVPLIEVSEYEPSGDDYSKVTFHEAQTMRAEKIFYVPVPEVKKSV